MTHAGIHAHGGDGAEPGGGGGGGGLIHLRPPEDVSADEWEAQLPARLYEDRLITASGGKGGGSAGDPLQASGGPGETTNFTTRHCLPGRGAALLALRTRQRKELIMGRAAACARQAFTPSRAR